MRCSSASLRGTKLARVRKFICSIARRLMLNESDDSYVEKYLPKDN